MNGSINITKTENYIENFFGARIYNVAAAVRQNDIGKTKLALMTLPQEIWGLIYIDPDHKKALG